MMKRGGLADVQPSISLDAAQPLSEKDPAELLKSHLSI
jgi:hypothetical protein